MNRSAKHQASNPEEALMNQLQGTRSVWRWVFGAWCCFGLWHLGFGASSTEFDFFERRIRPVLAQHCYECHSATSKSLKAGLRVDTRDGLRRGGNSGEPAVVPGEPENSRLLAAIRHTSADLQMPPKKKLFRSNSPTSRCGFAAAHRTRARAKLKVQNLKFKVRSRTGRSLRRRTSRCPR